MNQHPHLSFASVVCKKIGWINGLGQFSQLKSDEACMFYLKGWAETLDQKDADARCLQEALPILANDSDSAESLLQSNALNEVFFGDTSQKKINRLNRTLSIQWAIDIAAQSPKEETTTRLSTNLDTWLHEIADEDDRDHTDLWSKQFVKGKI